MNLTIKPISIKAAKEFIAQHHRHHAPPPQGAKFAVGIVSGDRLCAVATVGRPVARHLDDGFTAEITRVCTDGTPHSASMVITRAKRIAQLMGYHRVLTYLLTTETGVSLAAVGWEKTAESDGGKWSRPSRGRQDKHPTIPKSRWEPAKGASK